MKGQLRTVPGLDKRFLTALLIIGVFVAWSACIPAVAQDGPSPAPGDASAEEPAPDTQGPAGGGKRPTLDPFKALIEPKVEPMAMTPVVPLMSSASAPPPPTPPVVFKVNAVAGEHPNYVAVIEFEGQTYIVQNGTKVPDENTCAFEVKNVTAEKVEVFDKKTSRIVQKQLQTDNP